MADLLFPPHACISAQRVDVVSNTASARSIFTGATRTVDRGGDRFRWSITRSNASDRDGYAERAILKAFLAQARGQANRVWFSDPAYVQRGSFPATELLTNNTFANGTTDWTTDGRASLSVVDRVLRSTLTMAPTVGTPLFFRNSVSVTQYAQYVLRIAVSNADFSPGSWHAAFRDSGSVLIASASPTSSLGITSVSTVSYESTLRVDLRIQGFTGLMAGRYAESPYISLSRCALIDNGTNLLLQSDEFDTSWTTTRASIDDQAAVAPDGTSTADSIIEDSTANNTHFVSQAVTISSAALDYAFTVALKAGTRTWARVAMQEASGSMVASVYVNLSTGALGSTATEAGWANTRAFITAMGNGWYAVSVVSRKTSAATSITARIDLATANNNNSYSGDGSSNIYAWRATLAQSSFPTRLVQTTTAASSGTSQTGKDFYIKGCPASTNGLLLPGDRVQIGTQLCEVVAPLNSDAAGLGYLQLAWPLRTPPANNQPVIINNPMARCVLTSNEGGWSDTPGGFSEFDFQIEESLDG